jgi:hypothetical protein
MRVIVNTSRASFGLLVLLSAMALALLSSGSATAAPTCSGTLGIDHHGIHVVGDYVAGIGHESLDSLAHGIVGEAVAGSGAVVPGGPGPGFHFPNGFAPGASFCLDQSQAPGVHLGP